MNEGVIIEVNSNFHHCSGEDLFASQNKRFKDYRTKWQEWPRNFKIGEFPLFLDIEVTSICNLKCPFCATTFRDSLIKKGFISFEHVKKIIDEGASKNLYGIKFNMRGEPLLHPQIYDFVGYAKKKGLIDVYFNTNAVFLTENVSKKLIDAGLDRITISIEGYTKEVYERYRVGAKFETVLSNIENLQSLKRKIKVKHPKVRIQTVMLPEIEVIFDDYKRFWSEKAEEIAFLDYKQMEEKKKGIKFSWACPQLWQRMAVWWDGTILPCNHDDDGIISLGNLKDITIEQAWHSEKLNYIRDKHRDGQVNKISACDGCYLRDSEINKLMKKQKVLE